MCGCERNILQSHLESVARDHLCFLTQSDSFTTEFLTHTLFFCRVITYKPFPKVNTERRSPNTLRVTFPSKGNERPLEGADPNRWPPPTVIARAGGGGGVRTYERQIFISLPNGVKTAFSCCWLMGGSTPPPSISPPPLTKTQIKCEWVFFIECRVYFADQNTRLWSRCRCRFVRGLLFIYFYEWNWERLLKVL